MTNIDALGHLAYAYILLGMLCLVYKNKAGWVFRFVGEAGWVAIGVLLNMSSIWFWGLVFMCIDIKGYLNWRKNEKV